MATITFKIDTDTPITLGDIHDMATAYDASYIEVDGIIKYSNHQWEDEDDFVKWCNDDKIGATINGESLDDIAERREREDEEAEQDWLDRLYAEVSGKLSY
ncbi:MAG: hypothetical protein IJP79_07480 [Paludibacteraceae bacterium]|nr:hypothetical protein [Paludibacteraceae bacterium]MBQ6963526.1 hypothetical protein [Paludibacteraceae bacterium]MBQ7662460.1 hypothetical protein [Prevotella sp.]MBQ7748317.1 hypothetical protein [Paludibacteraceae bacterium]